MTEDVGLKDDEPVAARGGAGRRFWPLLALAALELVWCGYLAATRTIPSGHDGFQYFYVKYYFFDAFIRHGEVAEWLPYLTHGAPAAWWYVVQGGIFDPLALLLARALALTDFFAVFYGLLWIEKLFLMLGTWLLASEYLQSRAALFAVTAAVTTTAIWYTGAWWNFHLVLPLPFLMFCVHRLVVDFHWKWVVAASLTFFLQTFGQLSYYLSMTLFFLAAYGACLLFWRESRAALRARFHFSVVGATAVALIGSAQLVEFVWLRRAVNEMAFASSHRSVSGAVSFATFLDYAGPSDLRAWNQFFSGLTPHLDFTLFAGFMVAGLLMVGLTSGPLDRPQRVFAALTGLAILIGAASPVATAVFYVWPLGSFFRHLGLLVPFAKFFAILFAGATLDRLIREPRSRAERRGLVVLSITFTFWAGLLTFFAFDPGARREFVDGLSNGPLPVLGGYLSTIGLAQVLRSITMLVLSWVSLRTLVRPRSHSTTVQMRVAWAAALLLLIDGATYHYLEMRARTRQLPIREAAIFRFVDLPYFEKRLATPDDVAATRRWTFSKSEASLVGSRYGAENLLWLADTYQDSERTVYWSSAVDSLIRALAGRDSPAVKDETFAPPTRDPLMAAIGGLDESKVRFFRRAMVCPTEQAATFVFMDKAFQGQVPMLVSASPGSGGLTCDVASLPPEPSRISSATARTEAFSSNRVVFTVTNPTSSPLVMTYSDSWSPHWRARVDSDPVPVMRSDLAYKAIIAPPGTHRVEFTYRDPLAVIVFTIETVASALFLLFLAALGRPRRSHP